MNDISQAEFNAAVLETLADLQAQNKVLAEMLMPLFCEAKGISGPVARAGLNEYFRNKKLENLYKIADDLKAA